LALDALWLRADKGAVLQIPHRFSQLFTGIHDNRPMPRHGLFQRFARHQQETHALLTRLNRDFVASIKLNQRPVP